jgi:hypothetical protein
MNTHAAGTRLTALTEAWRAFLRGCPLAEPAMVSLEPTLYRISIQAGNHQDALDHLGELLLWAYTLDQVSARWRHTSGGRLHISIDGRASTGVALKVYGGIPLDHCAGLVQLPPATPRTCRWTRSTRCSACSANSTPPSWRWPHDERCNCC